MQTHVREAVVVTHGLWLGRWSLWVLRSVLRRHGYAVYLYGYRSVTHTLKENAERLQRFVSHIDAPVVHFVGHSLGGIVMRALFHYFPEQRPGRIVTIGAPHQGSHVADWLARHAAGRWILGRSVLELVAGIPQTWPLPPRDIGLVTGDFPYGLGRFFPGMTIPNDGLLNANETELPNATDRLCIRVNHTALQFSRDVAAQTASFLRTGRFEPF